LVPKGKETLNKSFDKLRAKKTAGDGPKGIAVVTAVSRQPFDELRANGPGADCLGEFVGNHGFADWPFAPFVVSPSTTLRTGVSVRSWCACRSVS
jgi:hypothetical protein